MRQRFSQKPPLGTPINWSHPLAKGLVGFWAFQEGGGDLANDLSGNKNHGTLKNMAFPATTASGWNSGKFGPAPKFDGSNDYVDCGSGASLAPTDAITVAAWIKWSGMANVELHRVINKYDRDYGFIIYGSNSGSADKALFYINNLGAYIISDNALTIDEWYLLVGTYDKSLPSANLKFYVNGVQQSTTVDNTAGITTSGNSLYLGKDGATRMFKGQMDEVRIYNRGLSAKEIIDSYIDPFGMFERNNLWDYVSAPPVGAVMNQFQKGNIGADLYDGVLIA